MHDEPFRKGTSFTRVPAQTSWRRQLSVAYGKERRVFSVYWVIQAGLLTPLTFARRRLSPLAAFTSGAYFLHNANFILPTLKAFFEARSHNMSGNKQ